MQVMGRDFSEDILCRIRTRVQGDPELTRSALSREVCDWMQWHAPDGRPKEVGCRVALLKLALVLNAAGILFGAVALFGEVSAHRHAVLAYKERIANRVRGIAAASSAPVGGKPSQLSRQAEWPCYACLAASLLVWCAFVISL